MKTSLKIIFGILGLIAILLIYVKAKDYLNGYYDDRLSCTFYGFGKPYQSKLKNGNFVNIGPYYYVINLKTSQSINAWKTGNYKISNYAKLEGIELELNKEGWDIPKIYDYSKVEEIGKVEFEYVKPIYWHGKFDMQIVNDVAKIDSQLKSDISDNDIVTLNVNLPIVEIKNNFDFKEYELKSGNKICFEVKMQGQEAVKFCNDRHFFTENMIKLVEEKYNFKMTEEKKKQAFDKIMI